MLQDTWQELQEKLADGTQVYAPRITSDSPSKKRKRQCNASGSRKNRQSSDSGESDVSDLDDSGDEGDKENCQPSQEDHDREPLTQDQIEETLASIKCEMKEM